MDYLHNGEGERVHRSGSGRTVSTVFDEAGRWLGDYDANGQPIQQAIWLDPGSGPGQALPVGLLVGAGAAQKLYYLQPDALGTPRVAIDPDRDVAVWRWDLAGDPYGAQPPAEDPDGDGTAFVLDLRFPGQRHDPISGLYENYFRDYDPTTGRYLQSDPIGLGDGPSTYAYAGGAPLGFSDPLGLRKTGLGNMLGKMIAAPIVQRMGGGLLARTASATAKARAQAQRAADMTRRLGRIFGRMGKGRGKSEPPGCGDVANGGPRELYRLGQPANPMERTFDHALSPQKYVEDVAAHYNINLRGSGQQISVIFDETLSAGKLGVTYASEGGRVIRIGPNALADQATTANTIAHELSHARDFL